jgi:hypothetical protein
VAIALLSFLPRLSLLLLLLLLLPQPLSAGQSFTPAIRTLLTVAAGTSFDYSVAYRQREQEKFRVRRRESDDVESGSTSAYAALSQPPDSGAI